MQTCFPLPVPSELGMKSTVVPMAMQAGRLHRITLRAGACMRAENFLLTEVGADGEV